MHLILNINLIFLRIYIGQNIEYSMTLKKFYDLNLNNLNIKIMLLWSFNRFLIYIKKWTSTQKQTSGPTTRDYIKQWFDPQTNLAEEPGCWRTYTLNCAAVPYTVTRGVHWWELHPFLFLMIAYKIRYIQPHNNLSNKL